uniref:DUF1308 domain-containing protein n=1 Tax=Kalanchoe fedtschenkoi TaxID=63787 RepID=A0A7N0VBH7_KALFE
MKKAAADVCTAQQRCRAVVDKINALTPSSSKISDSCKRTLLRLANSELHFLSRISSITLPLSLSVNIGYLEAVVYIIQQPCVSGISRVCKSIPSSSIFGNRMRSGFTKDVHVDIMCTHNGDPVWFIVSDRNPKHVSWFASPNNKGLKQRVEQVVDAAHSCSTLKPSSVIFFFANGINSEVQMRLKEDYKAYEFGIEFSSFDCSFSEEVESDWVTVIGRSFQEAAAFEIKVDHVRDAPVRVEHAKNDFISNDCGFIFENQNLHLLDRSDSFSCLLSSMEMSTNWQNAESTIPLDMLEGKFISFDTTALIAIVSGISNGGSERLLSIPKESLMLRFKSNYDFVIAQIRSEIQSPLLLDLIGTLSGKRGIICHTVFMEFKELVLMCGGKMERLRADKLLSHLRFISHFVKTVGAMWSYESEL